MEFGVVLETSQRYPVVLNPAVTHYMLQVQPSYTAVPVVGSLADNLNLRSGLIAIIHKACTRSVPGSLSALSGPCF